MKRGSGAAWLLLIPAALGAPGAALTQSSDAPVETAADLPFYIDLPDGFSIEREIGAEFDSWLIVRDGEVWMGVYTGCCSRFPYYDGRRVAFGDVSRIIVSMDGGQRAIEYLYTVAGEGWTSQIHVWLTRAVREDWALADAIAESIRPPEDQVAEAAPD